MSKKIISLALALIMALGLFSVPAMAASTRKQGIVTILRPYDAVKIPGTTEPLNGYHVETYPDGRKYEGNFVNGLKSGQGTMTWPGGEIYVGDWKDGKRNGQGTYTWADGGTYAGGWKDDLQHGSGVYTYKDGSKADMVYENGILISQSKRD